MTKVLTSSSTGSQPAADTKYELSNGQVFSTKGGVISEVISDGLTETKMSEADKVEAPVTESKVEEAKELAATKEADLKVEEAKPEEEPKPKNQH